MHKIRIIISREFLTRIRKPSFWVMTIIGPLLLVALWVLPFLINETDSNTVTIGVVDRTPEKEPSLLNGIFAKHFKNTAEVVFVDFTDMSAGYTMLEKGEVDGILEIIYTNDSPSMKGFLHFSENAPNMVAQKEMKQQMKEIFKSYVLSCDYGMTDKEIAWINNPDLGFYTKDIHSGENSYTSIKTVLGLVCGLLIYFFIFLFGSQVMGSVTEEKNSRIVEVLISSVKPFQLMMGKVIGVAMVGLTQFFLWIVLSAAIIIGMQTANPDLFTTPQQEQVVVNERIVNIDTFTAAQQASPETTELIQGLFSINYMTVLFVFLFFFLVGYFLYSALFAAVGAIIENIADANQFTLPITIPLILSIVMSPVISNNPDGAVAFWLSMIPFTAPIAMLIRIPFSIPLWQVFLSGGILIISAIGCVYFAAKIYRTGILMYGKKITYKELWKWLRYRG